MVHDREFVDYYTWTELNTTSNALSYIEGHGELNLVFSVYGI